MQFSKPWISCVIRLHTKNRLACQAAGKTHSLEHSLKKKKNKTFLQEEKEQGRRKGKKIKSHLTISKLRGAHKTWTEQKVYICCPLPSSLPYEDPSWTLFLPGDYLSGSHWLCTVSALPWINGTAPYLRMKSIISYLFSKSTPPDRFCLTSCSLSLTLLPTHSSPPYSDFSLCLIVGEFLLHSSSSIIPTALTPSHFSSCYRQSNFSDEKHSG